MTFDEYVAACCPESAEWDMDNTEALSIRDIADWCHAPASNFVKLVQGITLFAKRVVYASRELGLGQLSQPLEVPIQETLLWSRQQWEGRFILRRTLLWRLVISQCAPSVDGGIFTLLAPKGVSIYTLTPKDPSRWHIPFQQIHIGPLAIPPELADIPCNALRPIDIVDKLNVILGTHRMLEPRLESFV